MSLFRRLVVAAGVALSLIAHPAQAQNDRIIDTVTGWGYLFGINSSAVLNQFSSGNRPFNITRIGSNAFDTVVVGNSGAYSIPGATAYFNQTTTSLSLLLSNNNMRILDLEAYDNAGVVNYAAIVVPNSGATAAPGWGWVSNVTFADIVNWMNANPNLRLIDMDVFQLGGQQRYTAVAVPNSGANFQSGWWYGSGATAAQVSAALAANDARLIDIDVLSVGTIFAPTILYNYIMVSDNPGAGIWHGSATSQQVSDLLAQYGTRLTCFKRFTDAFGITRYAFASVDNANAQTRRMRDMISPVAAGVFGFRLKQVGGPVIADLNPNFVWEPASTVKLLHAVYAIWRCANNNDALENMVEYRNLAGQNIESECTGCAFDWTCTPRFHSLSTTLRALLEPSNNNALIALERRYDFNTLNTWAQSNGFGNIDIIRQNCDCGAVLNTATCVDICEMMEQVADGTLFNQQWQDTLYDHMNDSQDNGMGIYPTLNALITNEAAQTNLTSGEISAFRAALHYANKGGDYDCSPTFWSTEGGWVRIPFKGQLAGNWFILPREYVFSLFVHGSTSNSGAGIVFSAKEEIIREQIREALQNWDATCSTPMLISAPTNTTRAAGENVVFTLQVSGGGEGGAFAWFKFEDGPGQLLVDIPGQVSGATTSTITLINVDPSDSGSYLGRYTSVCGFVSSPIFSLTVTPPPACLGDANGDNVVNFDDINAVIANWLSAGPAGDANGDGAVNFEDINSILANWLNTCP